MGWVFIVIDYIEWFIEQGICLKFGEIFVVDIIVLVIGLDFQMLGGIVLSVDVQLVILKDKVVYKNVMIEGLFNVVMIFGYINSFWILKVDIVVEYVCCLLNLMMKQGYQIVVVWDIENSVSDEMVLGLFDVGYVCWVVDRLLCQGIYGFWKVSQNYLEDVKILCFDFIEDGYLEFDGQCIQVRVLVLQGFL